MAHYFGRVQPEQHTMKTPVTWNSNVGIGHKGGKKVNNQYTSMRYVLFVGWLLDQKQSPGQEQYFRGLKAFMVLLFHFYLRKKSEIKTYA